MALFTTLKDNFNAASVDTSLWAVTTLNGATVTAGGVLSCVPQNDYSATTTGSITSSSFYDLSDNSVLVQVLGVTAFVNGETFLEVFNPADNSGYKMYENAGTLYFSGYVGSYYETASITYNSTTHLWWRIREVSGVVKFETSADAATWTIRRSQSELGFVDSMKVRLGATTYGRQVKGASGTFDNFNIATKYLDLSSAASGGGAALLVSETASTILASGASGGGQAVYLTVYQALAQKDYEYRVFLPDGTYIGTWGGEVTSDFSYSQNINENATELNVHLARSPDNLKISYSDLQDQNSQTITDENSTNVMVQTATSNVIGPDTDVNYNYNVDVITYYGGYDNLLDELSSPITDETGQVITVQFGAPNGKRVYSGYIADISLSFGRSMGVDVKIVPHATEQSHYVFKTAGGNTTVTFNSTDPVAMARNAMDNYISQGGKITYDIATMPLSGTISSYDFKLQTTRAAIDKTIDLLPTGYYHFADPGENKQYMLTESATAHHRFIYEKHLSQIDLGISITNLINKVYFVGGETSPDVKLFKYYENAASVTAIRPGLDIISDSRVTLANSAQILSESRINDWKDPRYRTSIVIPDAVYDIENIKLGQMVGFSNFGTFVDNLLLQIVSIHRKPHTVTLDLDMIYTGESKRLSELKKQILNQEVIGVGSAPS